MAHVASICPIHPPPTVLFVNRTSNMKTHLSGSSLVTPISGLLLSMATTCYGQYQYEQAVLVDQTARPTRAGHPEFYLLGQYWHAEHTSSHNVTVPTTVGGSATGNLGFKFDDTGLFGIGVSYNLNNHFGVTGEFTFGYPRYSVTFLGS